MTFYIFLLFIFLTESRGSTLVAYGLEPFLLVYLMVKRKKEIKTILILFLGVVLFLFALLFLVHHFYPNFLENMVNTLKHLTIENLSSGRLELWSTGMAFYLEYPFLGCGFYRASDYFKIHYFITDFFPVRFHNTYVQIFSCTGTLGMIIYLFHRYQTALLVFERYSKEKLFYFLFYFLYLGVSFVDCHFFNIGPALLYGTISALLEMEDQREREEEKEHYLHQYLAYVS